MEIDFISVRIHRNLISPIVTDLILETRYKGKLYGYKINANEDIFISQFDYLFDKCKEELKGYIKRERKKRNG